MVPDRGRYRCTDAQQQTTGHQSHMWPPACMGALFTQSCLLDGGHAAAAAAVVLAAPLTHPYSSLNLSLLMAVNSIHSPVCML